MNRKPDVYTFLFVMVKTGLFFLVVVLLLLLNLSVQFYLMNLSVLTDRLRTPNIFCERWSLWLNDNDMSVGGEEAVKEFNLFDTDVERPVQQTLKSKSDICIYIYYSPEGKALTELVWLWWLIAKDSYFGNAPVRIVCNIHRQQR